VLVTGDGRTVVADMTGRTNVYDAGGAPLATWNPSARGGVRLSTGNMLLLRDDDSLWTRSSAMPSEQEMRQGGVLRIREGMAPIGEDGTPGEIIEPPSVDGKGAGMEMRAAGAGGGIRVSVSSGAAAPFTPALAWTMAANGDWVVGTADSYRFEIHHEAGGKTIVERYWEPVPVLPEEADYFISRIETMRQRADPSFRYEGPPVPTAKPAYAQLQVDRSGRIWVQRQGLGYRIPGCEDNGGQQSVTSAGGRTIVTTTAATPCWGAAVILDVFDASGDYLGEVIAPEGLRFGAIYIEDDLFLAAAEDDDGLVMVKKYRIAPAADSNP
jgi:hypothetical protein